MAVKVTSTNKVFYEALISESPKGQFYMTLTISAQGSYWTSEPSRLFAMGGTGQPVRNYEEAGAEADRQMRALAAALRGEVEEHAVP